MFARSGGDQAVAQALFDAGEVLYLDGDFEDAHEEYVQVIRHHAGFADLAKVIDREYEIGMAFLEKKAETSTLFFSSPDPEFGIEILDHLAERFEQSRFDYARYLIAEYHFGEGAYDLAAENYLRVEQDFPDSLWVSVARFQRAISYLRLSRGYNYDDRDVRRAESLLFDYLRRYPQGDRVKQADEALVEIRTGRARLFLDNARYYLRRENNPRAALIYLEAILRDTPDTGPAAEVPGVLEQVAGMADVDAASADRATRLLKRAARAREAVARDEAASAPPRAADSAAWPPPPATTQPAAPGGVTTPTSPSTAGGDR